MSAGEAGSRLRLDFVSPLPPTRSGIADYSADLLPALAERCDLRVVRLEEEVSPEIEGRWQPVDTTHLGEDGRVPFYQMGNNLHHQKVLDLARSHPGILTLHDLFLHHLLVEQTLARVELPLYRQRLQEEHGWVGATIGRAPRWGAYPTAPLFALPCHRTLVQTQRGVLVHSSWAAERLQEGVEDVTVRVIPMPMPLEPMASPASTLALRESLGIPRKAPVVGSFGFQTPIKRTDVVIEALAKEELAEVHLLIVGEVAPEFDLAAKAREAGVLERVHLCGFLDRDRLRVAMATADLCVNLRYPTAGETSASYLRLLAMGRPTLVSDYAQFAELGEEITRIPLGEEELDSLVARIRDLLDRPEELRAMGERARERVRREHDPDRVADRVAEACRELAALPPGVATEPQPPPPTSLSWGRLEGSLEIEGLDPPWEESSVRVLDLHVRNTGAARWLAGRRGDGGIAFEVRLTNQGRDWLAEAEWPPLPRDLEPGGEATLSLKIRRPLGPSRLRIEPHVLGVAGFSTLGGPVLERDI